MLKVYAKVILAIFLGCSVFQSAQAQDEYFEKVTIGEDIYILVPKGVPFIRGAIMGPDFEGRSYWQKTVSSWGFAIISSGSNVKSTAVLQGILDQLANASKRPEVSNLSFCLLNASAGAGAYSALAADMSDRIISFCPSVLGTTGLGKASLKSVPMLANIGEIDGSQYMDTRSGYSRGGAQHGYVVNWRQGHIYHNSPEFFLAYWDRVIRHRLPQDADPRKGPVKLRNYSLEAGWLGNSQDLPPRDYAGDYPAPARIASYGKYSGDKNKACWLPDAYLAHIWRSYNMWNSVSKVSPLTLGSPKRLTEVAVGASIPIQVQYTGTQVIERVDLHHGDSVFLSIKKNVYNVYTSNFKNVTRGLHTFLAVAYNAGGEVVAASKPATVFAFGASSTSASPLQLQPPLSASARSIRISGGSVLADFGALGTQPVTLDGRAAGLFQYPHGSPIDAQRFRRD